MGAREAKRSWPAVSHISNLIVRVGRLHFCVRKAAVAWVSMWQWWEKSISGGRGHTADRGLLVFLEVVVDEAEDEG